MAYNRPGVFVEESFRTRNPDASSSPSVTVFIADHGRGPTDPHLVQSFSDFSRVYGGFSDSIPPSTLPNALFQYFNNGGREAYIVRVVGDGASEATGEFSDLDENATSEPTLTIDASNVGEWGNDIYVSFSNRGDDRFDLTVYYGGDRASNIVERYTDISMNPGSTRYVESVVNSVTSGSSYITVTDLESSNAATEGYSGTRPEPTEDPAQLSGGDNGDAPSSEQMTEALDRLDSINRTYVLNYPGVHSTSVINSALTFVSDKGEGFVVIDTAPELDADGARLYAEELQESAYGAVYYPYLHIADPASNAPGRTKLVPPGGAVCGQIARTDATEGTWKAPAGLSTRIAGTLSTERRLSSQDLDLLAQAHVNPIRHAPGAGFVIWGARTLRKSRSDRYIPIRRTMTYLRKTMENATQWAVFEPNDATLWRSIEAQIENLLSGVWKQGGLRGETADQAFYVKCDGEINTISDIESGVVNVEVGVALQYPAEFIIIKLSQWEGGSETTEAA